MMPKLRLQKPDEEQFCKHPFKLPFWLDNIKKTCVKFRLVEFVSNKLAKNSKMTELLWKLSVVVKSTEDKEVEEIRIDNWVIDIETIVVNPVVDWVEDKVVDSVVVVLVIIDVPFKKTRNAFF
jgi:hypothetical protein